MDLLNPSMSTSLILSNWCSWSSFDCRSQVSFKEEHSFVFASFMLSAEWIMCRACFEAFLWQNKMQNAIVCKLDKAKYLQLQVCILWRCESMQAKIIMWKYASQVWQCVVSRLVWQALAKANMELGVLHLLTTAPKWNVMCDAKGQSGCLFFFRWESYDYQVPATSRSLEHPSLIIILYNSPTPPPPPERSSVHTTESHSIS